MNRGRPDTAVRTNPQACGRQHASWETEGDDGVLRLHETTLKILRKRLQRQGADHSADCGQPESDDPAVPPPSPRHRGITLREATPAW